MNIFINEDKLQFHLTNNKISYIFQVLKNGSLGQLYFGKKLAHRDDFLHLQRNDIPTGASCHFYQDDPNFVLETTRQEFPIEDKGDFRESAIEIVNQDGRRGSSFSYQGFEIISGKKKLEGLPATYAAEGEASTLIITLVDEIISAKVYLSYSIFHQFSVITRDVKVENIGEQMLSLNKLMSMSIDLPDAEYNMLHLAGAWTRERHIKERELVYGISSISSIRGASSHHDNPFIVLKRKDATEHYGEIFGFNFVYSSNFLAQVQVDHYDVTRVQIGIHPYQFKWNLQADEYFQSPEVVIVYSDKGLNGMSQVFHDLYRNHLIHKRWRDEVRPVLINNWEATYFDFNEDELAEIATSAKQLGIELFVLDDGWYGKRNDDTTSLGDWFENREKLPNGLESIAKKLNEIDMKFGIWFEPEMVSKDSNLYGEHPEWVIGIEGEHHVFGRNQLVLDYSNQDVIDYLYESISKIIKKTNLSYIKWDMNRNITDAYSSNFPKEKYGHFYHKYILGVYQLFEKLTNEFPNVLFESCAAGGGRFDPGMFYYAPQAWTSDNTDAIERLNIQYGTSLAYPIYSMGSHVSAIPNHQTLRNTTIEVRANVAYFGTFGYELNPLELSEEERDIVKEQIRFYKNYRKLVRDGDFYRLKSPFEGNEVAWMIVSKDKKEALVGWYKILVASNPNKQQVIKLAGLNASFKYRVNEKEDYFGDELLYNGLQLPVEFNGVNGKVAQRGGDYQSCIFTLIAE